MLDSILFDEFPSLRSARAAEDARIEVFFANLSADFLTRSFRYVNNQAKEYEELAPIAVSHFFNHQTHHRGQAHVMLSRDFGAPALTRSAPDYQPVGSARNGMRKTNQLETWIGLVDCRDYR